MSNLAKLKKKAADLEQKKQLDKALALYQQVVDEQGDGEDADVALCNRVGDLLHRAGRVNEAITYWERAAEMYGARGFLNNAIAICKKVLRASPASVGIHHTLGRLHAQKGLRTDARQHFLEYADRMQRLGQLDEAFNALKEFADLCPDDEDVRQSLAEQLLRHGREAEALDQLDHLYARYRRVGSMAEAEATLERIRAIDPEYEPRAVAAPDPREDGFVLLDAAGRPAVSASRSDDLVLIGPDTSDEPLRTPTSAVEGIEFGGEFRPPTEEVPPAVQTASALDVMDDDDEDEDDPAALGVRSTASDDLVLEGFEPTAMEPAPASGDSFISPAVTVEALDDHEFSVELPTLDAGHAGERPSAAAGGELALIEGDGILADDDDVRSHRSEDGDAAAELAAEAARRGHQPDVFDALGARDVEAPSGLGDLELLDPGVDDAVATATGSTTDGQGSELLIELPPMDDESVVETSDEDPAALWDAPPAVAQGPSGVPAWRRVSDALRASGDVQGALRELERVLAGFESTGDLVAAGAVIDEIIGIEPTVVAHHRRRVELAFRGGDRARLRLAYDGLAIALAAAGEATEAAAVRARIAELDAAARGELPEVPHAHQSAASSATAADGTADGLADFVNLGDLLRAEEPERTTRMVVEEQAPSGDEQADFAEMLAKFKAGLAENVDADDYESHHDLGVAFREMGLLDEAIVEFQKALRGPGRRLRSLEALGECFVEKEQYQLAVATLRRATQESNPEDEQLVGVWYLLGVALDALGQREEAVRYFERVLAFDYGFRDAAERVAGTVRAAS